MRILSLGSLALLFVLAGASSGRASDFEKLLMPGPLVAGHSDLEGDCSNCHGPIDRGLESRRCVECHEEVGADVANHEGLHGRLDGGPLPECRKCHGDHRGRDADIVGLAPELFDHARTDFALEGRHQPLACGECHPAGKLHREAPSGCVDCHRDDDVHGGELGDDCAHCHEPAGFASAAFDHGTTDFPLRGAHADTKCGLCHVDRDYARAPTDCHGCHSVDDAHRGDFGPACGDCHGSRSWKPSHFDHARETDFPLANRHAEASCRACHTRPLHQQPLDTACVSCHAADDVHAGRNGRDCASCHDDSRFGEVRFDHAETAFPLHGAHESVACEGCHRGDATREEIDTRCVSCHDADDPHAGGLGEDCAKCHGEKAFGVGISFDHDIASFPLLGMHAVAPCEACHASARFGETARDCRACHGADDEHAGRLGRDCASCHNPNAWSLALFEHESRTGFALEGAHARTACESCHRAASSDAGPRALQTRCGSCHGVQDVHGGSFGADCGRCHGSEKWGDVVLPR